MGKFDLSEFNVYFDDYIDSQMENNNDRDLSNVKIICDILPSVSPTLDFSKVRGLNKDLFEKTRYCFDIYNDDLVNARVYDIMENARYYSVEGLPFFFCSKFVVNPTGIITPEFVVSKYIDNSSYAFFGHEIHHALKDNNPDERKLRNRLAEVIPLFFELVSADIEKVESIKKEILDTRLGLMVVDKKKYNEEDVDDICIQYFNSFYYALCLYSKYKENPKKILNYVSKVLTHVINTQELLQLLNIYDDSLDDMVEFQYNKTFCKNS